MYDCDYSQHQTLSYLNDSLALWCGLLSSRIEFTALHCATCLKHVSTNDKMSPTVGFPTARLDSQFLTPVDHGYKMLRVFREIFLLFTAKILPTHRASAFEANSCVEPPIFDCQGSGVSRSVEVPSFRSTFYSHPLGRAPKSLSHSLKALYIKILCQICKPRPQFMRRGIGGFLRLLNAVPTLKSRRYSLRFDVPPRFIAWDFLRNSLLTYLIPTFLTSY